MQFHVKVSNLHRSNFVAAKIGPVWTRINSNLDLILVKKPYTNKPKFTKAASSHMWFFEKIQTKHNKDLI